MTYTNKNEADAFTYAGPIDHLFNPNTGELTTDGEILIARALDLIQAACWQVTEAHGFHEEDGKARNFGLITALLHSEVSEALESWRANEPPLWFSSKKEEGAHPDPYDSDGSVRKGEGIFAEFADVLIRLGDSSEELQRDGAHTSLAEAFIYKFRYNLNRPYKHGKIA